MRLGIPRQICPLVILLWLPSLRIAQAVGREAGPARMSHAGLDLALVRHVPETFGFRWREVQLIFPHKVSLLPKFPAVEESFFSS